MRHSTPALDYEQFIAFLLIYASYADLEFGEEEKEFIINLSNKTVFNEMNALYLSMSEFSALQLIIDHKPIHINNIEKKEQILEIVKGSFHADGDYSKLEKNLMNFLNHML